MGPSSHPLVKELLANESFNSSIMRVLAHKSGSILCTFARKTRIHRLVQDDGKIVEVLQCLVCDRKKFIRENASADVELNGLFKDVFQKLIGHEDKVVQKNVINSLLKPMFLHKLINSGIASLWLHW